MTDHEDHEREDHEREEHEQAETPTSGSAQPPPVHGRRGRARRVRGPVRPKAGRLTSAQSRLIDKALTASASAAALSDIEHVVILMQENRSFDHYFGTLSGVRGFSDPTCSRRPSTARTYPVFDQFGYQPGAGVDPTGYLQPFHLVSNPPAENGADHQRHHPRLGPPARELERRRHGRLRDRAPRRRRGVRTARSRWATSPAATWPSTTRWPTPSPSATGTTARCSAPPTRTGSCPCRPASTRPGAAGGPVLETYTSRRQPITASSLGDDARAALAAGVSWKVYNDPTGLFGAEPAARTSRRTPTRRPSPARAGGRGP